MSSAATSASGRVGGVPRAGVVARAPDSLNWLEGFGPAHLGVAAFTLFAFAGVFHQWMTRQFGPGGFSWNHVEDWGHAYAVPFISGYAAWRSRERLARLPQSVFWPGLGLILLGLACYVYFIAGYSNHMFQGLALVTTLGGMVLFVLGPQLFRALLFPLGFLLFAVSISEMVMIKVTWGLKLLASAGSEVVLQVVGPLMALEVQRAGNILNVTHNGVTHPLDVADACSGMRMVIAFVALSVAVAFLSCREWWQRVAVVLLGVPVALLMNVLRVSVLGALTIVDPELAVGGAHSFIGTLLLAPAFGLFMTGVWAVRRIIPDDEPTSGGAPA
ncbi:MAG TPA: hypothetical protein DEB06_11385 [Phycisphaerales bacterium]|nr:hypothetical protein [Phycisphaerales bacterium]